MKLTRRKFIKSGICAASILPSRIFARSNDNRLCSTDTSQSFDVLIFGRNDAVPERQKQIQSGLRSFFVSNQNQLRNPLEANLPGRLGHSWANIATRLQRIQVFLAPSLNGLGYAQLRGNDEAIFIDEGLVNACYSMSFAFAHLEEGIIDEREYLYYFTNLLDALIKGDPIPYVRGYNSYFKFIFYEDIISQSFFTSFHSCLNSTLAFVIYHECGHWILNHHQLFETNRLPPSSTPISNWTPSQLEISRKIENQADAFSMELCTRGLIMDTELGLFNWAVFSLFRKISILSSGGEIYETHPKVQDRFRTGMEFIKERNFFESRSDAFLSLFQNIESNAESIRGHHKSNPEKLMGDFSADPGLPESYYRFYRRDCNLNNFPNSNISIVGQTVNTPTLEISRSAETLEAIGPCHIGKFNP